MNVKRVGNVILAVKDLDKSVEFYHGLIGLPIKQQRRTWVDLGSTGALVSLHPASLTAPHQGTSVENEIMLGFLVGDLKSSLDELKSKGVKIYREPVGGHVDRDPDGCGRGIPPGGVAGAGRPQGSKMIAF